MSRFSLPRLLLGLTLAVCGAALVMAQSVAAQGQVDTAPITLGAGQEATVNVKAFCIEYGKPLPTNLAALSTRAPDPQVVQILRYAISRGYTETEPYQVQLAIWRQTTGEWKSTNHARAEEIYNNRAQAPAPATQSATDIAGALAANSIAVTPVNWTLGPAAPEANPWYATGQVRMANRGTGPLTVNVPVGVILDAPDNQQDTIMYVTNIQVQATTTPAATTAATVAATATQAATAAPAATATVAVTTAPAATATRVAPTPAPIATQTLPGTGGSPTDTSWLLIGVGVVMLMAGLALALRPKATRA